MMGCDLLELMEKALVKEKALDQVNFLYKNSEPQNPCSCLQEVRLTQIPETQILGDFSVEESWVGRWVSPFRF